MPSVVYEPKSQAGEYGRLATNPYLTCVHGCTYCYCPQFLHKTKEEFFKTPTSRKDFLKNLEKDCQQLKADYSWAHVTGGLGPEDDIPIPPIFLSFIGDCYQPFEAGAMITRQTIEILKYYGLNFTVLTKAGELAQRDFDLYGPGDSFGTTLTYTSVEDCEKYEPNSASPFQRLENLKVAHALGIRTWASMEPTVIPVQTLKLIELSAPFVDIFKVGKLNHMEPPEPIDWRKFALDAIALLEKLHKPYLIKADLAKYLTAEEMKN